MHVLIVQSKDGSSDGVFDYCDRFISRVNVAELAQSLIERYLSVALSNRSATPGSLAE